MTIAEFLETFYLTEGKQLITLESWQKAKIFEPVFGNLDPVTGLRRVNLALIGMPKKNGKSTVASGVALYMLLADGEPEPEVYGTAGDLDQAKIIFRKTVKAIRRAPLLLDSVKIYKDAIETKDGTGVYRVLSADAPTAHGLNPSCVIWDELWNQRSYDLWEALTHSPVRTQPLHFIVTYAGIDQSEGNLLWDLYQAGLKGEDPGMFFFWSHENLAGWITESYLAQQRRRLPDPIFRRLHRNEWTSGTGGLFRLEDWDACVSEACTPLLPTKEVTLSVGVDASIKRDRTAVVATYFDAEQKRLRLALNRWWQPTPAQPLNIEETVEAYLLDLQERYQLHRVRYDPYQFHRSATTLAAKGLPMEEYPQSTPNLTAMGQNLFELVKGRNLVFYPDASLREEAARAIAEETTRGWKISKAKSGEKIDQIVALAMAALGSVSDTREPGDLGITLGEAEPSEGDRERHGRATRLPELHHGVAVDQHAAAGCRRCVARIAELRS